MNFDGRLVPTELCPGKERKAQVDGCGIGEGIVSDTSFMTVTASEIHDIDRTGILANSAKNSITNNSVQHAHNYGVILDLSANGSVVSGNTISDSSNYGGIVVENATTSATVSKNTVVNALNAGIWLVSAYYTTVTQNTVSNSGWPLVCQFCWNDTLQGNTLSEAAVDGILDQVSYGGNKITKNVVNEAAYGVFTDSTVGGDTLVPNNLYNVVVTVDPNPTDGPPPLDQM